MTARYQHTLFTPEVKALQTSMGSRDHYGRYEAKEHPEDIFGPDEKSFIEAADSFYMATISATGWPYLQHRGGPAGFVKVIDVKTLTFADLRGNRQYISTGNLASDDRVSLFIMDYPRKARLKILGHAKIVSTETPSAAAALTPDLARFAERAMVITLEAFEWNCPKYITPRYTEEDLRALTAKMGARIAQLEAEVEALKAQS